MDADNGRDTVDQGIAEIPRVKTAGGPEDAAETAAHKGTVYARQQAEQGEELHVGEQTVINYVGRKKKELRNNTTETVIRAELIAPYPLSRA